eukprot:6184196-Pleurochrysis_carterae.AAC.1
MTPASVGCRALCESEAQMRASSSTNQSEPHECAVHARINPLDTSNACTHSLPPPPPQLLSRPEKCCDDGCHRPARAVTNRSAVQQEPPSGDGDPRRAVVDAAAAAAATTRPGASNAADTQRIEAWHVSPVDAAIESACTHPGTPCCRCVACTVASTAGDFPLQEHCAPAKRFFARSLNWRTSANGASANQFAARSRWLPPRALAADGDERMDTHDANNAIAATYARIKKASDAGEDTRGLLEELQRQEKALAAAQIEQARCRYVLYWARYPIELQGHFKRPEATTHIWQKASTFVHARALTGMNYCSNTKHR